MKIEIFLDNYIAPHLSTDRRRSLIKMIIVYCMSIPVASKRIGVSRQRGHLMYMDFIHNVVPLLGKSHVEDNVDGDIYTCYTPWLKLLSMIEYQDSLPSFVHQYGLIVRSSVVKELEYLVLSMRRKSSVHSVVDITDMLASYKGNKMLSCNDKALMRYIKGSMSKGCPTAIYNSDDRDYIVKIRHHDVNRILKMIFVSAEKSVSVDDIYQGYKRHLEFIGSKNLMTEKEHLILCKSFDDQKTFKDDEKAFAYNSDNKTLVALEPLNNPLSKCENLAFVFFKDFNKKNKSHVVSSMDIQSYMINHTSIASIRKMLSSSCVIVKESRDSYSLFGN